MDNAPAISPETLCNLLLTASESLLDSDVEADKLTGQRIQDALRKKQEEILQVEAELIEKEEFLNDNIKEIAELDETLLLLDDERKMLHTEMGDMGKTERLRKTSDSSLRQEVTRQLNELDINSNPTELENDAFAGDIQGTMPIYPSIDMKWSIFKTVFRFTASTSINHSHAGRNQSRNEMYLLRQKIAAQKAQIMKNLELCDKTKLDDEIAKLQMLQRRYFNYEKDLQYGDEMRSEGCLSSDETELDSEMIYRDTSDENSNSSEGRDKYRGHRLHSDARTATTYPASTITSRSLASIDNNNCKQSIFL